MPHCITQKLKKTDTAPAAKVVIVSQTVSVKEMTLRKQKSARKNVIAIKVCEQAILGYTLILHSSWNHLIY